MIGTHTTSASKSALVLKATLTVLCATSALAQEPDGWDRTFDLHLLNMASEPVTFRVVSESCCDSPSLHQEFGPVATGGRATIWIARRQGHGCDGEQGRFSLQARTKGGAFEEQQAFDFDNEGHIQMSHATKAFTGLLTKKNPTDGSYTWMFAADRPDGKSKNENDGRDRTFDLHLCNPTDAAVSFTVVSSDCCDSPRTDATYRVGAGDTVPIWLARVQGHGCDGKQGRFGILSSAFSEIQYFDFDNDGNLGMTNGAREYDGFLSRKSAVDGSYSWTWMKPWRAGLHKPSLSNNSDKALIECDVKGQLLQGKGRVDWQFEQLHGADDWQPLAVEAAHCDVTGAKSELIEASVQIPYHKLDLPRGTHTLRVIATLTAQGAVVAVSPPADVSFRIR